MLVMSENSAHGQAPRVVVPQQTAQPLAPADGGAENRAWLRQDQLVAEPLMVPLPVVVRHELVERSE